MIILRCPPAAGGADTGLDPLLDCGRSRSTKASWRGLWYLLGTERRTSLSEPTVLYDHEGGVALVTLNRPKKLNAFTERMHAELAACLDRAQDDPAIRAMLITGNGRAFSAGQDLEDRVMGAESAPPDLGATLDRLYNPLVRRIRDLDMPVVCAVNGIAAGAAANIVLACDIVFAARSAVFIQAFTRIGLMPDAGGTWLLPRLVGEQRAKALTFLAETITAEQAAAWGLVWQVLDDKRLLEDAFVRTRELARGPTQAFAAIKKAFHAAPGNSLDQQLELEKLLQRKLGRTADYAEGVRAFLGKRAPQFEGR